MKKLLIGMVVVTGLIFGAYKFAHFMVKAKEQMTGQAAP